MKRILFLIAAICLLAISAFAQNRPDYSGYWELDTINSKLDDRMRVESMTLKVDQTEKQITVGSFTKRAMPTSSSAMNTAEETKVIPQALTYSLVSGTALRSDTMSGDSSKSETNLLKASIDADGKLNLSSVRKINTQIGEVVITTRETWELADEGKTLRIALAIETPNETRNSEMVFTKKTVAEIPGAGNGIGAKLVSGTISGGVLNGKATSLVKPAYPEAARAVKAGGAVNVQVTIDETGKVISATAVSGHPLLRDASVEAAQASLFSPTLLQGVPVKVTGIIVYNFVP